jgi:glycosyltransferase involved in cell wall biosynthesis
LEILYLAHNRLEFTKASLAALRQNTKWNGICARKLVIYDDDSTDGTCEYLEGQRRLFPVPVDLRCGKFGSPVAVMNDYLQRMQDVDIFAKIDSDTMVPALWLEECLKTMSANSELDLLGIEAFRSVVPGKASRRGYDAAEHIGGIGLMRARAFRTLPRPDGRFGFTAWQQWTKGVTPGWLNPALPVFLLDRLPREPWISYSREYVARGWQREWPPYGEDQKHLWSWWTD